MILITPEEAVKLLENEVDVHRDNFGGVDAILTHSYDTGEIARETAARIGLDPEEAFVAGIFHDLGRCLVRDKKDHTFHEIVGARYVEENGVELGITDSQEQADRIAQSLRSHFLVYEQFRASESQKWLPGLRDTNPELLLPSSWNEVMIVYADLTNVGGKRISFEQRLADIKQRDKTSGNPRLKVVEKAESRLYALKDDMEIALESGETNSKYDRL
tara:strand:- start:280 stop:930 length:651 start_codon:yes stop_codon:yes gene_type:complete